MTIMFYVIACFLKVNAAGRCIIVSKKKNFFKKRTAGLRSERKAGVTLKKERRPLAEGKPLQRPYARRGRAWTEGGHMVGIRE